MNKSPFMRRVFIWVFFALGFSNMAYASKENVFDMPSTDQTCSSMPRLEETSSGDFDSEVVNETNGCWGHEDISLMADQTTDSLFKSIAIHLNNGTTQCYPFNEKPHIYFEGDSILVVSDVMRLKYGSTDVRNFTFEKERPVGIEEMGEEDAPFIFDGKRVTFNGEEAHNIVIYTADGKMIANKRTAKEERYSFSFAGQAAGVYLVSVNGTSYKLVIVH